MSQHIIFTTIGKKMTATIINAAPMTIMQGVQDLSSRALPAVPEALPTHLPKIYCYAQQGPTSAQLLSGGDLINMFGADTFDMRKAYATHATQLANIVNAQGNAIMFQRVIPADAGPNSSISLYLDVLPTTIPVYQRNADGSYKVDSNGNPVPASPAQTVPGYSCMWVASEIAKDAHGVSMFGSAEPKPGVQTDQVTMTQSQQFPIMDLVVSHVGSYGNNIGLRMWAPTINSSSPINPSLITTNKAYPFRMSCVARMDSISTPSTKFDLNGSQYQNVVFKANQIDKSTDSKVSIGDVFLQAYQALNVPGYAPVFGPFGDLHTYDFFIDTLLKQFYAAELPYANSFSDILGVPDEEYVFNMISGVSSSAAPYTTFVIANGNNSVYLTENTTIYATGGSDGTMGDATTLPITSIVGSISGDVLLISAGDTKRMAAGQMVGDVSGLVTPGTTLVSGSGNTWIVSPSQSVVSETMAITVPGFASLVADELVQYADLNSVLQDTAKYPESIFYDSGFPLATKYTACSIIAQRKDIAVVLCCHDTTGPVLTAAEESSLAIALRTHLQMYPESDIFGTATMRGMIVGRSGTMLNSQYSKPLPLVFEVAAKAANYMGASNGIWKPGFAFDTSPANQVTMFTDVNVSFTPDTVRNKDWSNGLVWVDNYDRLSLYFPAFKTVYDNDTSVLNSFFTMMACVELEKVGERARRRFSGESSLTDAQLLANVNTFVNQNTTGRFDGRFVIRPNAYLTAADVARGFSWSLAIKIYAPNMRTVMSLAIQSYRIGDLSA